MSSLSFNVGKKNIILLLLLISVAILLYYVNSHINATINRSNLSIWSEEYILTYNNHKYVVTKRFTKDVGQVIGSVSYHGNKPGRFKLFSIKRIDDFSMIAVETKLGSLIAVLEE